MGPSVCVDALAVCASASLFLKLEYQLGRCVIVSDVHVIPGWLQFAWYAGHTRPPPRNKFTDYYLVHTPRAHITESAYGGETASLSIQSAAAAIKYLWATRRSKSRAASACTYIYARQIKFYAYNVCEASCCLFGMQISRNKRQMRNPSTSIKRVISLWSA